MEHELVDVVGDLAMHQSFDHDEGRDECFFSEDDWQFPQFPHTDSTSIPSMSDTNISAMENFCNELFGPSFQITDRSVYLDAASQFLEAEPIDELS